MAITLNDFRALSNGKYNAGQIDFTTNRNGEVTGLKKVNNHVTFRSFNNVVIDHKRAVDVKEAFIKALSDEGFGAEKIAEIREKLGIAADTKTTAEGASTALKRRFTPLTREQVRDILRNYSSGGANAVAEKNGVREARDRVNRQVETLVKKSPVHEQLFALLAGKSCEESVRTALHSSPATMQILNGLRANRNNTALRNAWNQIVNTCHDRTANTLAALRSAIDAFIGNPNAGPQKATTPFGEITLSCVANEAMQGTHVEASIKVGNEMLTLELEGSPSEIADRLDRQIEGGAEMLGKERLGTMLSQAKNDGGLAEDSSPCLGRTVAATILKTFANIGQVFLDGLDNKSIIRYARDVVNGTAQWTENSIITERNKALLNPDNVKAILESSDLIDNNIDIDKVSNEISNQAKESLQTKESLAGGNENVVVEDSGVKNQDIAPQQENVPPQNEILLEENVPPPQEDKFEKLAGAPLPKDANDILRAPSYETLRRGHQREQERRVFNNLTLLFERPKDANKPVDDKASSVKTGSLEAPEHFNPMQRIENFTFAGANLPQDERKAIGDFARGLLRGAVSGDAAALKSLVAKNLHSLLLMAADPEGAAAFFPPEAVVDAKGLVVSLAEALKSASKSGAGRELDFRSFTQGDENAVRGMLERTKDPSAADALASKMATILHESVSVTVRETSGEAMAAAGAALGGTSADALAALARKNPLELVAFASGDAKIPGRNAAQTAEIKAAVMKAFAAATGKTTLAGTTLAEFDAFAAKCAEGALDKALGEIASRNALFGGELYGATGGSREKIVAAGSATKDLGAVSKAPQTAELKRKDVVGGINGGAVGGVTLHISEMLDSDAPHPRSATAADLRGLAADLLDAAEEILAKGPNASPEAIRAVMLKDIDAFCRFLDNPRSLGDAVMPQLRELVAGAMADVRKAMDEAVKAALGKELRAMRPLEIKQFVVQKMDAAALGKIAAAFATLAEKSAAKVQAFVNGVCKLDPNATIASEYDKMKPAQITASLKGKTLDDIIDDPIKDSSRPGMLAFQKKVLSTYFTTVSHERKAGVLASALRNAPDTAEAGSVATETKFLSAIFLGAGPLMQKTLQGIDRRIAGAHGDAFGVLKSSIPPLPDAYIRSKLEEIVRNNPGRYKQPDPSGKEPFDIPFVPLGAATVGQAVKCTLTMKDGRSEEVIVKIMRPGVKQRFEEDVKIFDAVAGKIPSVNKVWKARVKTIADEFDFRIEASNIEVGQVYEVHDTCYTKEGVLRPGTEDTWTVSAMKTPKGVRQTSDVLVGSVAPGEPFDKVLGAQKRAIHSLFAGVFETDAEGRIRRVDGKPVVRKDMTLAGLLSIRNGIRKAVKDISESSDYFRQVIWKWLDEALFKSGVMHNDVHTGNLMLDTKNQRATFIDFGNIVQLTEKDRISLLKMVAAVASKHGEFFISAFTELLGKGTPEQEAFKNKNMRQKVSAVVEAVIHKGKTQDDTGYRFQALLSEMQKLGADIPPQVAAFVEGLTRLQNCHEELADLLKETESLYQSYVEQVVDTPPRLAVHDQDDVIGRYLDLMVESEALKSPKKLDTTGDQFDGTLYEAQAAIMDLAWEGSGGVFHGSLVEQIDKDIEAEKNLPGNEKLAGHVSLVSRHAFPEDAARIDGALAHLADVKRRLHGAEASGANARADELRKELGDARNKLAFAVVLGVRNIQMAINEARKAKPPAGHHFETESAAEIFSDLVTTNFEAVKNAFTGSFFGPMKIGMAYKSAIGDDKKHMHDGHQKKKTNQL